MFAPLLLLYRNKEQRHLNTQGRLHQQLRKDPHKGLTVIQCSSVLQVPRVIPQVCDSAIRKPVRLRINNYSGLSYTHTQKNNSGDEDLKMIPTNLQSVLSAVLREQEQRNAAVLREQEQRFVQLFDALRVGS